MYLLFRQQLYLLIQLISVQLKFVNISLEMIYLICMFLTFFYQLLFYAFVFVYLFYPSQELLVLGCFLFWGCLGVLLFWKCEGLLHRLFGGAVLTASFLGLVWLFLLWFFDRIQYHYYAGQLTEHQNIQIQIKSIKIQVIILFPSKKMQQTPKIYISTTQDDKNQQLKLYTVFYYLPHTDHLKPDHLLAQINVLTENKSYEGKLKRRNINNQLAWNGDLVNRLENVLAGVLNNVFMKIQEKGLKNLVLVVANQFQMRSIRVTLFEIELTQIFQSPYNLMRTLMQNLHIQRQKSMADLRQISEAQKQKILKIDQCHSQIKQNHREEISFMKDKFILVINESKKRLIKCFGLDPNLEIGRLIDLEGQNGQVSQRRIYKIKEAKKNQQVKDNQPEKQNQKQKIDVQQLFD